MGITIKNHTRPLYITAALLLILTLSGCGRRVMPAIDHAEAGSPAYGDTIISASIGDATTLIPIVASDSASHDICGLVYNGLIRYDKDLNIIGELALNWDIEEEGRVIVFNLRRDVKWHDGLPFTAEDVKFTYEKLIDPKVRTPYSGDFLKIESLEIIDPYKIKVTYRQPFSPALSSWGMWIMPKHILENEDLNKTRFGRSPVGTGPYKFLSWKSGQRIDLVANDEYFKGRPYVDRYVYKIIPDTATMFLELQAEALDTMALTPLQYRRQTSSDFFKAAYNKFKYPSFGYAYLGYNLLNDKFKDKIVRQALNYAVNKEALIYGVLMGLGRVCTGPFVPESWAYDKQLKPSGYDPLKAKDMLAQAGWSDTDGDGVIEKDGEIFEFTILTNQGNDLRKRAVEIIQHQLGAIGIKVKIK